MKRLASEVKIITDTRSHTLVNPFIFTHIAGHCIFHRGLTKYHHEFTYLHIVSIGNVLNLPQISISAKPIHFPLVAMLCCAFCGVPFNLTVKFPKALTHYFRHLRCLECPLTPVYINGQPTFERRRVWRYKWVGVEIYRQLAILSYLLVLASVFTRHHQSSWPRRGWRHSRLDGPVRTHKRLSPSPFSIACGRRLEV